MKTCPTKLIIIFAGLDEYSNAKWMLHYCSTILYAAS